jgi:beta-lactamase regulating signal transducer with metallopeptidase domain
MPSPFTRGVGAPVTVAAVPGRAPAPDAQSDIPGEWNAAGLLGWIWLGGTLLSAGALSAGLSRLAWLASRAAPVQNPLWQEQLRELSASCGLTRTVQLLQSQHPALLVTWGLRSPKILLPATARTWPADRIRVVLAHELAHVVRHDWLTQISVELLRALYWFNPLVWLVARKLREESERACDDAVLERGIDAPGYATHLLEVARGFSGHRRAWSPAPAIASPSHLERRVRAMLNTRLNRRPITPLGRMAITMAVVGVTIPIAAMAQASFSTFSGSVLDPMNGLLPRTTLLLTNAKTQAKYEVRADESGRFELVGLPPSDYMLEAKRPGFATLRGSITVSGRDVFQEVRLNVGEVEETITVTDGPPRAGRPARVEVKKPPLPACNNALAGGIGGRIKPPVKIRDVRPVYPPGITDAQQEEQVRLDAMIGTDGTVKDLRVVGPAHPAFAASAFDAVREWAFVETLLNCVPVDVLMHVSVSFRKE